MAKEKINFPSKVDRNSSLMEKIMKMFNRTSQLIDANGNVKYISYPPKKGFSKKQIDTAETLVVNDVLIFGENGDKSFRQLTNLKKLVLGSGVLGIANDNLSYSTIRELELSEDVKMIPEGSIEKSSIKKVTSPNFNLSTSTKNTLAVKVTDVYGNESRRKNFYFYLIELKLFSDFNTIYKMVDETEIPYPCKPTGGAGLNNRYIRITLASIDNPNALVVDKTYEVKNTNINLLLPVEVEDVCTHGVYVLKASFCALLPNGDTVASAETSHQIIFYETEKNTPLITGHIPSNKVSQYDNIIITYMIVDQQATTAESDVLL